MNVYAAKCFTVEHPRSRKPLPSQDFISMNGSRFSAFAFLIVAPADPAPPLGIHLGRPGNTSPHRPTSHQRNLLITNIFC